MQLYKTITNLSFPKIRQLLNIKVKHSHKTIRNFQKFLKISKMPRDKAEIAALKEIRMKKKKQNNSARFPPGEIYLCVLGNGSISSPKALYMFTDHEKYLFNCGEGTQRLSTEHKTKLSKLNNIFITHKNWDNIGGLLGLSLTLQDMGVPELTLHGPSAVNSLFDYAKSFVILKNLKIETSPLKEEKFSDDCMDVHYIPIYSEDSGNDSNSDSSDSSNHECDDDSNEPKSKRIRYTSYVTRSKDMTVAYACKGHSKPGHLLIEKCVELGVPPGPLLGDLKNGKDVTLPSGKIVHSKDVVSEVQHCPVFLVVDCPCQKFLLPFVNEEKFFQYQKISSSSSEPASLVVHFTPPDILNSPEYQDWINKFPDTTCHLILNEANATLNSLQVHRIQHQLNLLHPKIFGLLHESEISGEYRKNQENIIQANTLDRYYLRPSRGLDRNFNLNLKSEEFIEEAMQTEGFEESLSNLKNNIHQHSLNQAKSNQYPIVTFLGTGSSIPSKARNVSAILLNTSENKYILLDCGEGTHSQLVRLNGKQHEHILEHLNCVFISHMHADHHLGLIKILRARERVFQNLNIQYKPLLIIGPKQLNFWLKKYHRHIESITYLYRFLECEYLDHNQLLKLKDSIDFVKNIQISTVPVYHCPNAYGAIIASDDFEWKVVYSGDTLPCENLVDAGQNCSILIHEATMEDDLLDEAIIKRHSTTSQAIKIGDDMKANYTLLTHFSQRYAKIPLFNENFHNCVGCAFDNMTVRSDELYILPLLIPTLKCLFAEEVEDMNTKGDKRKKRIELINTILKESVEAKM